MAVRRTPLNVVDGCTLAYNAWVLAFILAFRSSIPAWQAQASLSLAMIVAGLLIAIRDRAWLPWRLIRSFYPLVFLLFMYEQTGRINHVIVPGFLDTGFQRLEGALFGIQPAVALARWFPQPWLAEYMHFAYATYYGLFTGMGIFLFFRRGPTAFADYMLSLCGTFYVCYLTYVFLPVRGAASYGLDSFQITGPFTRLMAAIYGSFEIEGAAFPSSHVAIATVVLYYTFRYARRAAWGIGPIVISLMVATVYCRYHYAIDVLAGVATAAVLIPLWRRLNPALRQEPQPGAHASLFPNPS